MTFPKLNQVFPNQATFDNYCDTLLMGPFDDEIYAYLMIEYGESTMRYSSLDVAAMKVLAILNTHYPIYLQKKEALEELRQLDLEEFAKSDMSISNVAQNPNNEPTDEILPFVSQQQTTNIKRGKADAILVKYRTALYGHIRTILRELAPLFKGIHAESEDVYLYDN